MVCPLNEQTGIDACQTGQGRNSSPLTPGMWYLDPKHRHPDAKLTKNNSILRNATCHGRVSACGTTGMRKGVHRWRVTLNRGRTVAVGVCDISKMKLSSP